MVPDIFSSLPDRQAVRACGRVDVACYSADNSYFSGTQENANEEDARVSYPLLNGLITCDHSTIT
jgi:hypothetical protein